MLLRNGGTVAGFAVFRRRLVEQNHGSLSEAVVCVAGGAGHIFMSAFQGETSLFVIEERGAPLVRVVAGLALTGLCAELIGVRVFMTIAAMDGGFRELDVQHGPLQIGWPVAGRTLGRAMRASERKASCVMVEFR